MLNELVDLLKVGEAANDFEGRMGSPSIYTYTISSELAARLFREFSQLGDEVDLLTELLSQKGE